MKIAEIDHIHLYVENIEQAEKWYNEILGFERDPSLYFWFEQGGPLVIRNNRASLSLFLRKSQPPGHTVAFGWQPHLSTNLCLYSVRIKSLSASATMTCRCPSISAITAIIKLK